MEDSSASRKDLVFAAMALLVLGCDAVVRIASHLDWLSGKTMRYAVASTFLQVFVMLVMVLGLVFAKAARGAREARAAARKTQLLKLLAGDQPDPDDDAVARRWPQDFLQLVSQELSLLPDDERHRIVKIIRADWCRSILLREIEHPSVWRSTRAIQLLSELPDRNCFAVVTSKLDDPSETLRVAAAQALMKHGPADRKLRLLRSLPRMQLWARLVVSHSISASDTALPRFLDEAFASGSDQTILNALDLVCNRRLVAVSPVRSSLATSKNLEIRIRFFKALPYLNTDADPITLLRPGLEDVDWRVRMMAASACAHFRPAQLAGTLLEVFRAACNPAEAKYLAEALAALGGEAHLQLEQVAGAGYGILSQIAADVVEQRILALAGASR